MATLTRSAPALPADLLAALDDSDDERDGLPSFYYKPNVEEESPEKPSPPFPSSSDRVLGYTSSTPLHPIRVSPSNEDARDYRVGNPASTSRPLWRSTNASQQSGRDGRAFARVASVPSAILQRDSDGMQRRSISPDSPREVQPVRRNSREQDYVDPKTPSTSNYLASRSVSTASRPTFPNNTASKPRDFPSITPGIAARYNALTASSTSSSRLVALSRTSSSPATTPESDGTLGGNAQDSETSPELQALSPRPSPNGTSSAAHPTHSRSRVMSGRLGMSLGNAPPVRGRKIALQPSSDVIEESEEERVEKEGLVESPGDDRLGAASDRLAAEMKLAREHEEERAREAEMEAEVDRELQRDREALDREREGDGGYRARHDRLREMNGFEPHRRSPPTDPVHESAVDDVPGDVSPTQRDYGYIPPPADTATSRGRAASSSEHYHTAVDNHPVHHRAASALDNYPPSRLANLTKPQPFGKPIRPGQAPPPTTISGDSHLEPVRPRSRGARLDGGNGSTLRAPPAISRQSSAPAGSLATSAEPTPGTSSNATVTAAALRHRRNPTAPSPPTTSSRLRSGPQPEDRQPYRDTQAKENRVTGATWSTAAPSYSAPQPHVNVDDHRLREVTNREVNGRDRSREKDEKEKTVGQYAYHQHALYVPPSIPQPQPVVEPPAPAPASRRMPGTLIVGGKAYQRLDLIGKGGSSRVYRVISPDNGIYALKRVDLENADQRTIDGYKNEIALLKRLEGNRRIIRLIEFDTTSSKKKLMMIMECGEVDLAKLLFEKQGEAVDFPWLTSYWHQMLQAVHVIHEEKIVHSDLKPANFVLVKGSLKLIDFGIAKAIPNDTTNIKREEQIGTLNYMSPEAIEGTHGSNGVRVLKLGRASDVWSLGCILYQMIYEHPPFYFLTETWKKVGAIPNPKHAIEFPAVAVPTVPKSDPPQPLMEHATAIPPDIIATMRNCLDRDPKLRPSIPDLLAEKWNMNPEPPEPPRPTTPTPLLRPDEAIIDDHMIHQLMMFTLANLPSNASQAEVRTFVPNLRLRLQDARKHRS